jgi:hypothetical protein
MQGLHTDLSLTVKAVSGHTADIHVLLERLRQYHHPSDLHYTDATRIYLRLRQELRDLERIAALWELP